MLKPDYECANWTIPFFSHSFLKKNTTTNEKCVEMCWVVKTKIADKNVETSC